MWEEYVRMIGEEIKCANTNRTDNGEGKPLCTCIFIIVNVNSFTNN
jgi:hypothetical protein